MRKIILMLTISLSFAQADSLKEISLQLKWKYQFQFAGFIMAKEKGFYKDVGLDVKFKELQSSTNTVSDVIHRKSDFGVSDSSLVYDALLGKDVVAMMAIFQHSPFILLGLKHKNINTLEDLNTKKIALHQEVNGVAIKAMLKSNNINYISKPPLFSLNKLKSGEVDFMSAYISNEPYIAQRKKLDIVTFYPKDYGFDSYGDILFTSKKMLKKNPKDVQKMYAASYKGWEYAWSHLKETVDVIYTKYNTQNRTKDALFFEAKKLKELSGYDENFGEINKEKIKSIAQLFNLITKGHHTLSSLDHFIYHQQLFTAEESRYIQEKKIIKVCAHRQQSPFVIFEKNGYSGISMEYLKKITQKSNLRFKIIPSHTLQSHLTMLKNGKCDMSAIVLTKPNIFDYLTPTSKIASGTIVLVTKATEPYISDLNSLGDKKISIQKGAKNLIQYVKSIYPHIHLIEIIGNDLSHVESGEFYGHIGASYQLSHAIAKEYSDTLKIMSKIGDKKLNGSFGVTNREPILLGILNKVIDNMSTLEKQKIDHNFLSIKIEKEFNYSKVLIITLVALVIIMTLIYFMLKQKRLEAEILEINTNLKEKVKTEVEKNKQQQLLMLQQNRLAQMGEMISMIAHQWRQPLNTLAMLNQTIILKYKRHKLDDALMDDFTVNSKKQIDQMSNTIDDFRNFFSPEKEKVDFSINEVIHHVLEILKPLLKSEKINITVQEEGNFTVHGHPNELGQAILNIISNAKDALIEKSIKNKQIHILLQETKNSIMLRINDNAGGIPNKIIDKIFDPYFSTKTEKNGTGLGLYMTKMIINNHSDGTISVENDEQGTIFSIRLKGVTTNG